MKKEYCECESVKGVWTDVDDFGQWDVCCECNKRIEDSYEYFNHYDGEDHIFYNE